MTIFNFNDLSKQAKIDYNALYNVIFPYAKCDNGYEYSFIVPLCLNSDNKISLTEKNFIFFESVLSELNLYGWYSSVEHKGRAFDDVKGDFFTVEITVSNKKIEPPENLVIKTFDFSDVDTTKLLKRNGKEEKQKTAENKEKEEQEKKAAEETSKALEETSKALEEKTAEVENLKKEVAKKDEQLNEKAIAEDTSKKDEQLNKKAIAEFNDEALFSIADCVEFLVKKHCPIPAEFDFSSFEDDLFKVINSHWDLKVLDK